jgi:hypothetical protein
MTIYPFDLPLDSDLSPCPEACGGPCKACWDKALGPRDDEDEEEYR